MFECKYPGCLTGKKKMNKGKNMVVNTYKVFRFPKDDTYFSIWGMSSQMLIYNKYKTIFNIDIVQK